MKFNFPPFVLKIFDTFHDAGFEIYVVGGIVRDLLLDRPLGDWDFTTNATPEEILKLFPDGFYNNIFGTVGIQDESSEKPYEITTYRRDVGYSDKRHPDRVEWGLSLEEDLARRDFTIGAMALDRAANLIDPYEGQKDLSQKVVRAVGDPITRFDEDSLRMMRAVRIATELGFTIEDKTFEAIKHHAGSLPTVSSERIRDELLKIMASDFPAGGVLLLRSGGLLPLILPQVERAFGVEQKSPKRHHIYDVGIHLVESLKHTPSKDPLVRLATLLHDIGKVDTQKVLKSGVITFYNHEVVGARMTREIADSLKLSKKQKDKLWVLVRWHQFTVDDRQTDSAIRRFIRNVGHENLQDMIDLRVGDRLGGGAQETSWRLEKFKERIEEVQHQPFSVKDLKVNGRDVMEILGVPSGPKVGEILNNLFAEVEQDVSKNEREYLIGMLEKIRNDRTNS